MSMKKWLATALACSALLTACGGQSESQSQESAPAGAQGGEEVYRVANSIGLFRIIDCLRRSGSKSKPGSGIGFGGCARRREGLPCCYECRICAV